MTNHQQEALGALQKSREWLEDGATTRSNLATQRAQVHATLALVEQQRIANLISYFTQIDDTSTALPVLHEIVEALGLGDTDD